MCVRYVPPSVSWDTGRGLTSALGRFTPLPPALESLSDPLHPAPASATDAMTSMVTSRLIGGSPFLRSRSGESTPPKKWVLGCPSREFRRTVLCCAEIPRAAARLLHFADRRRGPSLIPPGRHGAPSAEQLRGTPPAPARRGRERPARRAQHERPHSRPGAVRPVELPRADRRLRPYDRRHVRERGVRPPRRRQPPAAASPARSSAPCSASWPGSGARSASTGSRTGS